MINLFKALLGYHLEMSWEDYGNPKSKLWATNENMATLRDLMKKLSVNTAKSQELQSVDHKNHSKKHLYHTRQFVWLSANYIKTKGNLKLEYK